MLEKRGEFRKRLQPARYGVLYHDWFIHYCGAATANTLQDQDPLADEEFSVARNNGSNRNNESEPGGKRYHVEV
jgi:hypothetical protein